MKTFFAPKRLLTLFLLSLLAVFASTPAQSQVLISQIYGGGGNNGASWRYDYVMLYNAGTASVDLSSYTLQYASATSTSASAFTPVQLSGSIAAGKYYLAQLCIGNNNSTNGTLLPNPDFTAPNTNIASGTGQCVPALAAGAGKVALVNNTTALSGTAAASNLAIAPGSTGTLNGTNCPTTNVSSIVDFVAYGAGNCYLGSTAAADTLNATSAATRNSANANTGSNAADFTVLTPPAPMNSLGQTAPGTGTALAVTTASASPNATVAGGTSSVTFTVVVAPGTTSTGIAVKADLSKIGGSATQAFTLSGTANTYTFTTTVGAGSNTGSLTLPVTVTDTQSETASKNITLTVYPQTATTPIPTLQGNRTTYVGQTVATTGVVTSLLTNGFFIQLPSANPGSTGVPEGINVFTSSAPTVAVGDNVTVTGSLQLFPAATASATPALEIAAPAITTNSNNNMLPNAITLSAPSPTDIHNLNLYSKYEGMRVQTSLTVIGSTGGNSLDEVNEKYASSNGRFYAVVTGTARPFREPGVDVRDAGASQLPSTIQRFDDNPERILVDTTAGGNTALLSNPTSGAVYPSVTGVMDFTFSNDSFDDPVRLLPDAGTLSTTASGYVAGMTIVPVPAAATGQATVAAFNIERFFNDQSSDNIDYYPVAGKTETSEAVVLSTAAYQGRQQKLAMAIRQVLQYPDIIAFEEAENQSVLSDISKAISVDALANGKPDPAYVAYGTNNPFYTNDEGGISTGFLIKPGTVDFQALDQYNNMDVFTPTGGKPTTVNDRPPLVLHAGIKRGGTPAADYPITVIVNHLKALPDNTTAVQQKKELQAETIASLIQQFTSKGEHVLAVGDFNAFEFSDGYGDYLGTVTNNPLPANQVVTPGKSGILTTTPVDLITKVPAQQRYTYVEDGNAQVLDHIVASADIAGSTGIQIGRVDADFPVVQYNDTTVPNRVSDHDPVVAYLSIPPAMPHATYTGNTNFPNTTVGTTSAGQVFTITNVGGLNVTISGIQIQGTTTNGPVDFAQTNNCPASLTPGSSCQINITFTPTAAGTRVGLMYITNNGGNITPFQLQGTGVAVTTPPVAPSFTLSAPSVTVPAGTTGTGTFTIAPTGGFTGTVAFTCTGATVTGATCSVTPSVNITASTTTANVTVTITTTARTVAGGLGALPRNGRMLYAMLVLLMAGGLFAVRKAGRNVRIGGLLAVLFALTMGVTGCSSKSLNVSNNANGTPAGTYTYTITGTGGGQTKTTTATVTVQ